MRAIPNGIREAAYALGATRWQVVKDHLLPYSAGGIATFPVLGGIESLTIFADNDAAGRLIDDAGGLDHVNAIYGLHCDPKVDDPIACARTFIKTFGKRAYRRPITDEEVDRLLTGVGELL